MNKHKIALFLIKLPYHLFFLACGLGVSWVAVNLWKWPDTWWLWVGITAVCYFGVYWSSQDGDEGEHLEKVINKKFTDYDPKQDSHSPRQ